MSNIDQQIVCGADLAECRCIRPPGHEGNHHCDCGGQFTGSDTAGDAVPKKLPVRGNPFGGDLSGVLDAMFGDPD